MSVPPITTVLRRLGWSDSLSPRNGKTPYVDVCKDAYACLRNGGKPQRHHVDQTCVTLFGALPNEYLRHACKGVSYIYAPSGTGWSYGSQLNATFRRFLLRKLFWFKDLKQVFKIRLYSLCETEDSWSELSNLLQTVEGRVIAALLSVGDKLSYDEIDALNVSICSNLLNNPTYHRRMKTYLKQVRKAVFSGAAVPVAPNDMSCLYRLVKKALDCTSRDEKAYRIATLCQTRAGGISTPTERLISAQKWVETVTESLDGDPDYALDPLELALNQIRADPVSIQAHMRVSVSTSACLETSRAKGGKLSHAARLLADFPQVRKIDLETGQYTAEFVNSRESAGEALFHLSLAAMREDFRDGMTVRASIVNEPGAKARVITADSFYHSVVLGPWSHAWLYVLRDFPAARAGVSEGRHGWTFIRSITASRPDLAWIFDATDARRLSAISTDLSEATDHLFWSAAKALLDMANRVLRFPSWYADLVKRSLTESRNVSFRDGKFTWKGESTNGIFMGDTGCKVLLTMSNLLAVVNMSLSGDVASAVVGDDHTTLTRDPERSLEVYRRTLTGMGYVLSEDDTFISDRYGFYAEELYTIPADNRRTVDALIRKTASGDLPYIDVPKVRLLMDLRKDRKDFSSTKSGRIYQFGREVEYNMRPTRYLGLFYMASWIQDACLDLRHCPEFGYFPRTLVSAGKPILFDNEQNFVEYLTLHKRGRLKSRYAYLMKGALSGDLKERIIPRFFTKTGEHHLQVVQDIELPEGVQEYLLFQTRKKKWYQPWIVGRIQKYIISDIEIKSKLNQLAELFDEAPVMVPATVENVATGSVDFTDELCKEFTKAWRENSMLFARHTTMTWYLREPVERILDLKHPLSVSIPITWTGGRKQGIPAERMLERDREALQLLEWVLTGEDESVPPSELLPDDLTILESPALRRAGDAYVVTADWKLCKYLASINWRLNLFVIPPKRWIESQYSSDGIGISTADDRLIVDQGSVDAYVDTLTDAEIDILCDSPAIPLTKGDLRLARGSHASIPREIREAGPLP